MTADLKELAGWLVSNPDKQGSEEWQTIEAAFNKLHDTPPADDKYQQWAKKSVAQEQKAGSYLPGVMQGSQRKILQGLTGNFADDALAYGSAFIDPLLGRGRGLPFDERLKYEKARQSELNRVADEQSGVAGDVAGGLASAAGISRIGRAGGTLMRAGMSLPGQVAAGAAEGAGYGALYGAGEGDGLPDKASKAISGGLGGGVFGGVLPAALAGVKYAAAKPISNLIASRDPEGFAAAKYGSAMLDAGQTPQSVMRQVSDANAAGVPLNIADAIGKNGQRLLYTAASSEGPGREMVTSNLNARQAGQGERVSHLVDEALGADSTARQAGDAFIDQARRQSRPLYDAIPEYPESITPRVASFLREPTMQEALRNGVQIQRNNALANGEDLAGYTLPEMHRANNAGLNSFSFRNYQAMKIGLDDMLEKYRNPMTGQLDLDSKGISIQRLRQSLDQDLKQMFPGYAEADAAYAGPASIKQAIGLGSQMARGGRFEDNVRTFNRMSDAQKVGARIGYADKLSAGIENSTQGTNAANRLLTPKKQGELEAMSLFQGPSRPGAPNEIARRLAWENQMNQTRQQALMGSRTAENLADQQTGGVDPRITGVLHSLISGHPMQAAGQAVGHAFHSAGNLYGGNTSAVREQLARIGLSNGNVDIARLLREATAKGRRARIRENRVLQGLLGGGAASIGLLQ
jgi:hypothetical protein